MESSSYYKRKYNRYVKIKKQIKNALNYFDNCYTDMNKSASYLEELIVNKKTFDDGKMKADVKELHKVNDNLIILLKECNNKISYYDNLYNKALKVEAESSNQ